MSNEPLHVLLVDDEPLAREHVKRSVEWEPLGLQIVGEAATGGEALNLVRDLSPALALVDINIPYPDGLTVSERIRSEHPLCKVVVLTGFDDFEHARRALRAGAVEYVLKPLASDELTAALIRARDEYHSESRQRHYRSQLEATSRSAAESAEEAALGLLLASHGDAAEGSSSVNGAALAVPAGSTIAVFRIDGQDSRWPDIREQNRWHEALREIIRKCSADVGGTTTIGPDGLPVFVTGSREACDATVAQVRAKLSERFDFTVSVGVSPPLSGSAELASGYSDALAALRERYFSGVEFTGIAPVPERRQGVVVENKGDILLSLRMGDLNAVVEYIDAALEQVRNERLDRESVHLMAVEMAAAGAQFLTELERVPGEIMDESGQPWSNAAQSQETLDDLRKWLVHLFERIVGEARNDGKFKTFRVVETAVAHLQEHFADHELSLRSIADGCNVNPTYLSKVFKAQTGHSVIEYLRSLRLDHAKKMMQRSPASRVNEIADACGFSDPLYFSKVFKTEFGVSPRRFMRR